MAKRILVVALILIIAGVSLVVYHDPQFRQAVTPSSSSPSSSSSLRFVTGSSSTSQTILSYSAVDIIESLLGLGVVGVGLVLVGLEIFSAPAKTG